MFESIQVTHGFDMFVVKSIVCAMQMLVLSALNIVK